mmetsp:Transcript_40012/g.127963  ORF Transcript_40012/g.127963 Transcript_40012/m.127963 type:complete len:209 (+) Transcript_40012:46-672(+)
MCTKSSPESVLVILRSSSRYTISTQPFLLLRVRACPPAPSITTNGGPPMNSGSSHPRPGMPRLKESIVTPRRTPLCTSSSASPPSSSPTPSHNTELRILVLPSKITCWLYPPRMFPGFQSGLAVLVAHASLHVPDSLRLDVGHFVGLTEMRSSISSSTLPFVAASCRRSKSSRRQAFLSPRNCETPGRPLKVNSGSWNAHDRGSMSAL